MTAKNKFRNTIFLTLFVAFSLIFIFRSPLKVYIKDQISEITYLKLSWVKSILTGNDFGFYNYENKLADQFSNINDYIKARALADSENLRKRSERDRKDAELYGGTRLARDLLARAVQRAAAEGIRHDSSSCRLRLAFHVVCQACRSVCHEEYDLVAAPGGR